MQVELSLGTTLNGRFQVDKVIGVGGFGITYLGHHIELGYKVAVKEYFIAGKCVRQTDGLTVGYQGVSSAQYEKYRSRFLDEARTLVKVQNRHVVSVLDVFEANNTAYIVMEFVEGITLQEKVRREGALAYPLAVNYIAQLSEAVECCHQHHILHRDIKPDNIMITPDDRVVLIDFGSARGFINDEVQKHTAILTQGYAPIEQYTSTSKKGNYTDIYSLGGVFYFVVTAQKPMDATDRMLHEMPSPRKFTPNLPEEAEKTIMKAMQMKPEERYQSVGEFMDDLVGKQVTAELRGGGVLVEPKRKKSGKIIAVISVIVLLLAAGAGAFVYINSAKQDTVNTEQISADYLKACRICNHKLNEANDYSMIGNFFEGVMILRDIEKMEADSHFPKTITIGSDTLFVKLTKQLTKASASLQNRMNKEPIKDESNTRWLKYIENRRKLDFWIEQLPSVRKASDFQLPQPPKTEEINDIAE